MEGRENGRGRGRGREGRKGKRKEGCGGVSRYVGYGGRSYEYLHRKGRMFSLSMQIFVVLGLLIAIYASESIATILSGGGHAS